MTGSCRTLKDVTRRTLPALCLWRFHELGLWFQCSFSKARAFAAGSDSSRWLTVTSLLWLLIKIPEATLHCALCTHTWGYCWFLCISRFYFESRLIFSRQNPHRISKHTRYVFEASTAVCEVRIFLLAFWTIPLPSKVLTDCPWFWGERNNFSLRQKSSEALPNWKINSNFIASPSLEKCC